MSILGNLFDPLRITGAVKKLAGTKIGSVLTGRAVVERKIARQNEDSKWIDFIGSPATAGTKQQTTARTAAIVYLAAAAPAALKSAALSAGASSGFASGAAAIGAKIITPIATQAVFKPVVAKLQSQAMAQAERDAEAFLAQYQPQQQGGPMWDSFPSFDFGGLLGQGISALQNIVTQKMQQRNGGSTMAMPGGAPLMVSQIPMPAPFQVALGTLPMIGRAVGAVGSVAAGILRTAAGKIRGVMMAGGRFVSSKKAVALAKRVGIDAAAVALGVSTVEMAQMVIDDTGRRGRGRGITSGSMKTTRRTIRQVVGLHRQIVSACSVARGPRRSSGARFMPRAIAVKCK